MNNSKIICTNGCAFGYFQKDGNCIKCKSPCRTCKDTESNCITCDNGHYYDITYNQICK